jgi:hypothetical protein
MKYAYIATTVILLVAVLALWWKSCPNPVPRDEALIAMGLSAYCALGIAVLFWR